MSQTWTVAKIILVPRARTVLTSLRKKNCPAASRSSAASVQQEPRRMKERVCVSPSEDVFTVLFEDSGRPSEPGEGGEERTVVQISEILLIIHSISIGKKNQMTLVSSVRQMCSTYCTYSWVKKETLMFTLSAVS